MKCCVGGCYNSYNSQKTKSNEKISFHSFPPVTSRTRREWIEKLKTIDRFFELSQFSKVCSDHFTENSYIEQVTSGRRLLKADSVPTIFPSNDDNELTYSIGHKIVRKPISINLPKANPKDSYIIDSLNDDHSDEERLNTLKRSCESRGMALAKKVVVLEKMCSSLEEQLKLTRDDNERLKYLVAYKNDCLLKKDNLIAKYKVENEELKEKIKDY